MSRLKPQLGLFQGIAMLATTMLGTGIFVVPAITAEQTGAVSLLAWGVLLILTLPIAFTFAALGKKDPHAGGVPHIVGKALGRSSERLTAFLFFTILPVGMPASLVIGSHFVQALIPLNAWQDLLLQLAMLAAMFVLGLIGAKASGQLQVLIAGLIITLVGALWITMAPHGVDFEVPSLSHAGSLMDALGLMFWCVIGIEAFSHMGEEFKRPERDFPLALIIGTLVTLFIYWAASVLILKDLPLLAGTPSSASLGKMATIHLGPVTGSLVTVLGFFACFASTNVYVQGYARLLWSLADEGKLPRYLAQLNHNKVPVVSLMTICGLSFIVVISVWALGLKLPQLLLYTNGNFVVIYLLAMIAGVIMLKGLQRLVALLAAIVTFIFCYSLGQSISYVIYLSIAFLIAVKLWQLFKHLGQNASQQNN
ncbi:L-methionine/branched-chain amino acid transporter [Celerinatantimonas diazotrophica]|uniref:Amino acid exporter (AAE family) n=1 Tax=Celerinatantimonas diazotrophica TaxID=412034 RepID=A0A4R1J8S6_9GAMM|nr:L-methionine/branched-chain amino acid transporter [Celerinatantimonas diazotrophica]TCK46777.1 amino acid exporter (AAE family) [Celerinatantimonas diazotrophica]CAG9295480.1 L-methionine/branched-chain amino acid exporter YjeH [Celerinatantimonas diazotrophica]